MSLANFTALTIVQEPNQTIVFNTLLSFSLNWHVLCSKAFISQTAAHVIANMTEFFVLGVLVARQPERTHNETAMCIYLL